MPDLTDSYLRILKRAALDCVAQFDSAVAASDEPEAEDLVSCLRDLPTLVDEIMELRAQVAGETDA